MKVTTAITALSEALTKYVADPTVVERDRLLDVVDDVYQTVWADDNHPAVIEFVTYAESAWRADSAKWVAKAILALQAYNR